MYIALCQGGRFDVDALLGRSEKRSADWLHTDPGHSTHGFLSPAEGVEDYVHITLPYSVAARCRLLLSSECEEASRQDTRRVRRISRTIHRWQ
jgi:hypothetical protein